jgi:dihydroorotate dehydrogenase
LLYRLAYELALSRIDPERAHHLAREILRALCAAPGGCALLAALLGPPPECLRTEAMGLSFPSPLGAAAGLDKDATWFEPLAALGFGFIEVGTLTAHPQPGNPRPRLARVARERALVNRLGFPNRGAAAAAARLRERRRLSGAPPLGVNIGPSRGAGPGEQPADLRLAARKLAPLADYLVVNVSSPNTPGLREAQASSRLRPLLEAVREELEACPRRPPLLVKLSPDLADAQLRELAELALELELDGIVAVNTTADRGVLGAGAAAAVPFEGGGVSGPPLAPRALQALRVLRAAAGPRLALVSVGGVIDAAGVLGRLAAGANLVQAYTGFVYGGPAWVARINRELARAVRAAGQDSLAGLIQARAQAAPHGARA